MSGYVYAVEAIGLGVIKVGSTYAPKTRLAALRGWSPVPLRIHRVLDCGSIALARVKEADLLDMVGPARSHGEWLRKSDVIDDLLDGIAPAVDVTSDYNDLTGAPLMTRRHRGPAHFTLLSLFHEVQLVPAAAAELKREGVHPWHLHKRLSREQREAIMRCHRLTYEDAA